MNTLERKPESGSLSCCPWFDGFAEGNDLRHTYRGGFPWDYTENTVQCQAVLAALC